MSESVIADFVAKFNSDRLARTEPIKGRVLLSQKRLVLAVNDNDKLTIPLDSIYDIAVGKVPDELDGFFQSTVTVAFQRRGQQFVGAIEGDDEKIQKFSNLLFKAVLNGTETTIKHPVSVGGRVTDADYQPAKLVLQPREVQFKTNDEPISVHLAKVTQFRRADRIVNGEERPVLEVRHMPAGKSLLTVILAESPRKMGLIGRYLRLEFSDLMAEIKDLELSKDEKEILVAIYSGAGSEGISLATIVDTEPSKLSMMLNRLENDDLLVDADDGTKLTPKGIVLVNKHLEDVND